MSADTTNTTDPTDVVPAEPDRRPRGIVAVEPSTVPVDESELLGRWSKIQVSFVKDPHDAIAQADALITEIVEARRKAFDEHRAGLAGRWRETDADTEDLRLVLQDYRKLLGTLFPRQA